MKIDSFKVVHRGKKHNCYLNHLGEIWIIEEDGSQTSSSKFIKHITSIEEAKLTVIAILKMFGR